MIVEAVCNGKVYAVCSKASSIFEGAIELGKELKRRGLSPRLFSFRLKAFERGDKRIETQDMLGREKRI
jgi:hypothetical protein